MIKGKFIWATLLTLAIVSICSAQEQVATRVNAPATTKAAAKAPVYTDYRGVAIGMTADEVRSKLDGIKKGNSQDFLAFSEHETAQIYYDDKHKVTAISIDYIGDPSKAPTPETVLGATLQAKPTVRCIS